LETTIDDCAAFVLVKLAAEKAEICHAERAFGDYVCKRCLDFADTLFAKKRAATATSAGAARIGFPISAAIASAACATAGRANASVACANVRL